MGTAQGGEALAAWAGVGTGAPMRPPGHSHRAQEHQGQTPDWRGTPGAGWARGRWGSLLWGSELAAGLAGQSYAGQANDSTSNSAAAPRKARLGDDQISCHLGHWGQRVNPPSECKRPISGSSPSGTPQYSQSGARQFPRTLSPPPGLVNSNLTSSAQPQLDAPTSRQSSLLYHMFPQTPVTVTSPPLSNNTPKGRSSIFLNVIAYLDQAQSICPRNIGRRIASSFGHLLYHVQHISEKIGAAFYPSNVQK